MRKGPGGNVYSGEKASPAETQTTEDESERKERGVIVGEDIRGRGSPGENGKKRAPGSAWRFQPFF